MLGPRTDLKVGLHPNFYRQEEEKQLLPLLGFAQDRSGPSKYLFFCQLAQRSVLSVEGAGETLQEKSVLISSSSGLAGRLSSAPSFPRAWPLQ